MGGADKINEPSHRQKGYYNNQEETKKVLKRHNDGSLWLYSGDLGYMNEDGNIFLEGRLKRIIVCYDGIKISPFSLENTIMKHKNVAECCVVGQYDKEHQMGQVPVAFVTLKENNDTTMREIEELCRRELSERYRPQAIVVLDNLPLTPNGKVDYRALEKEAAKQS